MATGPATALVRQADRPRLARLTGGRLAAARHRAATAATPCGRAGPRVLHRGLRAHHPTTRGVTSVTAHSAGPVTRSYAVSTSRARGASDSRTGRWNTGIGMHQASRRP